MNFKRKSFPLSVRIRTGLSILFLSLAFGTTGQTSNISGIINTASARIEAVYGVADTDVDSIKVNSTTGFAAGDTVLIYMSVGASITTAIGTNEGKMGAKRNSGKYAVFIIQSIDIPGKFIILNSTLPDFVPLLPGEFGQVVKVPTYRRAVITNTLTCNPYDTASKTGGILVLLVKESLNFNADINVDGKGFPGANPDAVNYPGTCSTSDPTNYLKAYFTSIESNFSASKGYGVTSTHNSFVRGNGANINGGGGGNGKFSGGGGGANGGDGGSGGNEYADCGMTNGMGGKGGRALSLFYDNTENRIGFGGGGGTSAQILPGFRATKGGNGGGIVIIVCDSLIGNKNIYARGESVTEQSTAGAGGGGGGGTIILHVNTYLNSPKLWVTGGNGGSVSSLAPLACGPGGGGGGGVIWHNGTTLGGPVPNLAFGINGTYNSNSYGSLGGSLKPKLSNLIIPIRGFIFNHIPNADTICFGDAPLTINAARPVGGTGDFFYNWDESTDSVNWTVAAGKSDTVFYTPPPSTSITKYYRRRVYNPPVLLDTSNVVKMHVMPVITNNAIKPDTTVCANLDAGTLYPALQITGGNDSYRYKWEKSPDGTFTPADSVGDAANFNTPVFSASTWYRRVATSGPLKTACKSTSNAVKITVLPVITNNTPGVNQEICITRTPSLLTGNTPGGGAGAGSYTYKWQKKTTGLWSDEVATASYQPPSLTSNHDYRRIVYSGPANTCKDTSAVLSVTVMPDITNNTMGTVTQDTLCSGLNGEILTGSDPQNGNLTYSYYWQRNNSNAPGGQVKTDFNPGTLTSASTFRRVVTSGTNPDSLQRCISISNERTIVVLQNIANNTLSATQTIWCEGKTPNPITGQLPLNGSGAYTYSWQSRLPAGSWTNRPEITQNFTVPVITDSVDYRRIVRSGLNATCKDTSNIISLIMQDSILNNRINENLTVFVCFDEDSTLQATLPGTLTGGSGAYSYLWSQSSSISGTYNDASQPGKTNPVYLTEPIQTARYYKRKVNSGDCESTSLPVKIDPLPLPELTALNAGLSEVCFNKMFSLINVSAQFGTLPYLFTFSDGRGFTDNRSLTASSQTILPEVSNPPVSPGYLDYNYKAVSLRDAKGCLSKTSNLSPFAASLRVYTTPVPSRISELLVESCSSTLKVSVNPSFGISSWNLSNVVGITADNTANPDINLTANYASSDQASVSLAYVENIANCPSDTIKVDAILYQDPDAITNIYRTVSNVDYLIGSDTLFIFISDNQDLKAAPVVSGVPGWSITSGSGTLTSTTGITTKIDMLEQDDPAFLKYTISNGVCPVNERTIKIVRKELLVYDGFSPNEDDVNDELWAVGLADEEVDFKFQLFSSSGNFFHEITRKDLKEIDLANNQVVLWDGTTNLGGDGNYVPDGTYYYVLMVKYRGEDFNKKGYIIVKR